MRQLSIKSVCTLSITAATIAVIAVLVFYVSTSSYRMVAGVQTEALDEVSKIVARSAEIYINQSIDVATILARQKPVLDAFAGQPQEAQELLRGYVKSLPGYWSFLLFDLKGRVVAGVNADMADITGGDRADRDYVRQIISGKDVALSESVMKAASGDVLIYVVAKAVHGSKGELLGAVAVAVIGGAALETLPLSTVPAIAANESMQASSQAPASFADVVDHVKRVFTDPSHYDASDRFAFTIQFGDAAPFVRADFHARDVLQQHRRAIFGFQPDLAQVV